MNEESQQNPETTLFGKETTVIPFNTERLVSTYSEQFDKIEFEDGFTFFTEKKSKDNEERDYRYVASNIKTPTLNEQDLYTLDSSDIWDMELKPADYTKIDLAGQELKEQIKDPAKKYWAAIKTIVLTNGCAVRLKYLPYTLETSNQIMDDIGKKNIAE